MAAEPETEKHVSLSFQPGFIARIRRVIASGATGYTSVAAYLVAKAEPQLKADEEHLLRLADNARAADARDVLDKPWRKRKRQA